MSEQKVKKMSVKEKAISAIDAAGKKATAARGTEFYSSAIRILTDTFMKNYYEYLFCCIEAEHNSNKSEINEIYRLEKNGGCAHILGDGNDALNEAITVAIVEFNKNIDSITEKYDETKVNGKYGFFYYLDSYISKKCRTAMSRNYHLNSTQSKTRGVSDLTRTDQQVLKRMNKFYYENNKNLTDDDIRELADEMNMDFKKIYDTVVRLNNFNFVSLDESLDEDSENTLASVVEDKTQNTEAGIKKKTDKFAEILEILNIIYVNEFSDSHRQVYPHRYTNDTITERIDIAAESRKTEYYQKTGTYLNRESVIKNYWSDLEIEDSRRKYLNGQYYMLSRMIFDWFEADKKAITNKEIADRLGINPPRYTKICNSAKECIRDYLMIRQKNAAEGI